MRTPQRLPGAQIRWYVENVLLSAEEAAYGGTFSRNLMTPGHQELACGLGCPAKPNQQAIRGASMGPDGKVTAGLDTGADPAGGRFRQVTPPASRPAPGRPCADGLDRPTPGAGGRPFPAGSGSWLVPVILAASMVRATGSIPCLDQSGDFGGALLRLAGETIDGTPISRRNNLPRHHI